MKTLALALVIAAGLAAGCKGKQTSSGDSLSKMGEFKDEMCKCKDAKCAQDVSDKMTKWSQDQAKNSKEPPKMDEATQKKATEIGTAMGDCMQKAMGAGAAMGGAADGSAAAGSGDMAGSAAPAAGSADGSAAPAAAGSADGSAAPAAAGSAK
jgi:hypothetical protein